MSNRKLSASHSPLRGLGIFGSGWHKQNCVATCWSLELDDDLTGLEEGDRSEWEERSLIGNSLEN